MLECQDGHCGSSDITRYIAGCVKEEKLKLALITSVNSRKGRLLHY